MSGRDFSGKQVGRYFLSSLLGFGAAGSVYRAIDTTSENSSTYAVKCVQESDSSRRRRQQIAEMDNHFTVACCPHVLKLIDVIEEDGHFFLVFPLCEMDMFKAIWKDKVYWRNDGLIKEVFVQILDGVFACHRRGVFHRDLKPENIMCDAEGKNVRIGDFGLSSGRRVCRDGGCGTSGYMSPECLKENISTYHADPVDVWSLGVILFNMVACRSPWEAARETDETYMTFRRENDYLLHTTPISEALNDLLAQIWHPIPLRRLPIPAIREAILGMDSFYKPHDQSASAFLFFKETVLPMVDPQQTCVAPVDEEKEKVTYAPSEDTLQDIPLSRLELSSKRHHRVTMP